jgi:type II secretory pathway pseudopilin PulG
MSFVTAAIIGGGATLAAGYLGSQAAKSAANKQADAARYAAQLQQEQFDLTNEQQKPYREAGYTALSDISGMKPYLTKQFTPEDFAAGIDPGYAFRQQQGQEATNRMANTAGGLIGGNALQGLENYSQGLASQEYGNAFNRFQTGRENIYNTLASIAGLGQTSLGQTTAAGTTAAGNIGANIANAGAAQAGGIVGSANALAGGLTGVGQNYMLSQILAPKSGVNYGLNIGGGGTGGGGMGITAPSSGNIDYMGGGQGLSLKT